MARICHAHVVKWRRLSRITLKTNRKQGLKCYQVSYRKHSNEYVGKRTIGSYTYKTLVHIGEDSIRKWWKRERSSNVDRNIIDTFILEQTIIAKLDKKKCNDYYNLIQPVSKLEIKIMTSLSWWWLKQTRRQYHQTQEM